MASHVSHGAVVTGRGPTETLELFTMSYFAKVESNVAICGDVLMI